MSAIRCGRWFIQWVEIVPSGSQGSFPGGGSVLVVGIDVGAVVYSSDGICSQLTAPLQNNFGGYVSLYQYTGTN